MNPVKIDSKTQAPYSVVLRETEYKGVKTREVFFRDIPPNGNFNLYSGEACVKLGPKSYRPTWMSASTDFFMDGDSVVHVEEPGTAPAPDAKPHPCTRDLCEALGWQGGTIHQVLAEIIRLRAFEKANAAQEPAPTKEVMTCPKCGGFDVHQDANYRVNDDDYSVYDQHSCDTCSYDGHSFNSHTVPFAFDYEVDDLAEATAAAALIQAQ